MNSYLPREHSAQFVRSFTGVSIPAGAVREALTFRVPDLHGGRVRLYAFTLRQNSNDERHSIQIQGDGLDTGLVVVPDQMLATLLPASQLQIWHPCIWTLRSLGQYTIRVRNDGVATHVWSGSIVGYTC